MAQALAQKRLGSRAVVESAGVDAADGLEPTHDAVVVMANLGLDITTHRSRDIEALDLESYDLVVALASSIANRIRQRHSLPGERLREFNVPDPYGKGITAYTACVANLNDILDELFPK